MLLVLVFVAMPIKYIGDEAGPVSVVGTLHGFLFMVYLLLALDLCVRARWSLPRTLLLLVAGTVPFLSFVAERKATGWVRERLERDAGERRADVTA